MFRKTLSSCILPMAIRALTRTTLHHFLTKLPQIPSHPIPKFSSFSRNFASQTNPSPKFTDKSHYRQQILLANLLQRYGFSPSQLHEFLKRNAFLLNFSLVDIEKSLGILLSFKLSQKSIVSILSACPGVLDLGFLQKWETGFSGLMGFSSVSPIMIQSVLEYCRRFRIQPNDLRMSLLVLKDMGFSDETVARVLEEFPRIIMMKKDDIASRIDFLMDFGFQWEEVDRICYSVPNVLGFGIGERLKPLVNEFEGLGFNVDRVRKEIVKNPRIFGMEVGELSRCQEFVKSLKCRFAVEENIRSMGAFRAGFEVKLRVDCLCRHGMIHREAFKVLQREPRSIIYELEDVEKKIEFLIHKMGFSIGCLIEVPEYLGVNYEKQIVPRYNVIEYLRSKGWLGCEVGLRGIIKPSRLQFYNIYVKPYPECDNIFGRFSRNDVGRNQNPVGLWKLFKPPAYPYTKEDVRNMKSFMESGV